MLCRQKKKGVTGEYTEDLTFLAGTRNSEGPCLGHPEMDESSQDRREEDILAEWHEQRAEVKVAWVPFRTCKKTQEVRALLQNVGLWVGLCGPRRPKDFVWVV